MAITFWNVLRPEVDEIFMRTSYKNSAAEFLIFRPEGHSSFSNVCDPLLSDGWPSHISACISQEMFFGGERLNLDSPKTLFLLRKKIFKRLPREITLKLIGLQSRPEKLNHRALPALHYFTVE